MRGPHSLGTREAPVRGVGTQDYQRAVDHAIFWHTWAAIHEAVRQEAVSA